MRSRNAIAFLALSLLFTPGCGGGGGSGASASPATIVVTSLANSGVGTLRIALFDATDGSTITFDPALAGGTITLFNQLQVNADVTILGPDPANPIIIDGNATVRHLNCSLPRKLRLENLRLHNGYSSGNSGAIFSPGDLVAVNCTFSNNESGSHGGVVATGGTTVRFDSCHFIANQAEHGGVLRLNNCDAEIERCSFTYNLCTEGRGAAIAMKGGSLIARNTTMHRNVATGGDGEIDGGGAIYVASRVDAPDPTIGLYGCTLTDNEGPDAGGGLLGRNELPGSVITITIRQTIVAGSISPMDPDIRVDGDADIAAAYSLIGVQDAGATVVNGVDNNIVGDNVTPADPMLDSLVDSGSGTLIRFALHGSPVLNVVPHAGAINELGLPLMFDQRMTSRSSDVASDIGAAETTP